MRRRFAPPLLRTLSVALWVSSLLVAPASATPLEALRIAWDDCPTSAFSAGNKNFACDTNVGSGSLYCAFSVAQPIDQIIGIEIVVDVQQSAASIPDWWQLGPAPSCRHDELTASLDFSNASECEVPGFTGALVQDYIVGEPRDLASQARIKAVCYVPSPQTLSVGTDTTYHAVRLVLGYAHTTSFNVCSGCLPSACLVFNSVLVRRVPGAPGGDVHLETPGPGNSSWATWRASGTSLCMSIPVRPATWGQIKSLYR